MSTWWSTQNSATNKKKHLMANYGMSNIKCYMNLHSQFTALNKHLFYWSGQLFLPLTHKSQFLTYLATIDFQTFFCNIFCVCFRKFTYASQSTNLNSFCLIFAPIIRRGCIGYLDQRDNFSRKSSCTKPYQLFDSCS